MCRVFIHKTPSFFDETREFVELLHKHGYDVLTKNDQEFEEKLDSYNRVLELQAKKSGLTSYTKYELEELCVCGDYMFVENDYNLPSKEVDIKDARGGKREGAGRKSKHKNLEYSETTTIRVPKFFKKDIKELIDFIIENPASNMLYLMHVSLKLVMKNRKRIQNWYGNSTTKFRISHQKKNRKIYIIKL